MRPNLLGLFALGHVANGAGHQESAVRRLERAQADLSRELGAVLTSGKQLQACPHRPRARIFEETVAVVHVYVA
jgi:hypothetical protein